MKSFNLRRSLTAVIVAAICLSFPAFAGKRRSVGVRSPGVPFTVELISGQVLDSVTGEPVVAVTVVGGNRLDATNAEGRFDLKNVAGQGSLVIQAERSGYKPYTQQFKPGDPTQLTIRMIPTPTVTIRKANGENLEVDMESLKFGYPVPFSGYRDSESEDFCTLDGTKRYIHRIEMARLTGPAVLVAGGACCSEGSAHKMTLTLKTGQTFDVIFTDTCEERYKVDIGARLHKSGQFVHVPITDIAEILFP